MKIPFIGKNTAPVVDPAQLTEGINLSRKEFASVGVVVKNMAKKTGQGTYTDADVLVNEFKAQMRQLFDVHITFEDLRVKDDAPCNIKVVACRFAKKRPLIFLAYEEEHKTWFVLDEKRFNVLEDPNSPFLGVNI